MLFSYGKMVAISCLILTVAGAVSAASYSGITVVRPGTTLSFLRSSEAEGIPEQVQITWEGPNAVRVHVTDSEGKRWFREHILIPRMKSLTEQLDQSPGAVTKGTIVELLHHYTALFEQLQLQTAVNDAGEGACTETAEANGGISRGKLWADGNAQSSCGGYVSTRAYVSSRSGSLNDEDEGYGTIESYVSLTGYRNCIVESYAQSGETNDYYVYESSSCR